MSNRGSDIVALPNAPPPSLPPDAIISPVWVSSPPLVPSALSTAPRAHTAEVIRLPIQIPSCSARRPGIQSSLPLAVLFLVISTLFTSNIHSATRGLGVLHSHFAVPIRLGFPCVVFGWPRGVQWLSSQISSCCVWPSYFLSIGRGGPVNPFVIFRFLQCYFRFSICISS
jgi:hypothetical protein